ncbi:MAG: 7-carboxy-7-deazaguanine synthase [Marinoscillum sp.]|jgi:7-carboxy-7-deazaguanine synthase
MKPSISSIDLIESLPLMEAFYTIQGEGAHSGKSAYFIRLGGCDVGCVWCDVKDSWDAEAHPKVEIDNIILNTIASKAPMVVVTGGEPLMYDLGVLTQALAQANLKRHIETAGVYALSGEWEWICFSPKKFKKPLSEFYEKSHELKIVIYNKSDFAWAESHAEQCHDGMELFLQAEWSKKDQITPLIVEYVKNNPKWRISVQTHKYMNIP